MTVVRTTCTRDLCVVHLAGPLRLPLNGALREGVGGLLRKGNRRIVLELARVSKIDAAGVGELVRAYNMTTAANGELQIAHATPWVREILDRVGLFDVLSAARHRHGDSKRREQRLAFHSHRV